MHGKNYPAGPSLADDYGKLKTKADQVAELIWDEVCRNEMVSGDKLPTEMVWAKRLGVSRLIVREAIARLRGLGVVESKPRVGLRVSAPGAFNAFEFQLSKIASTDKGLRELSELRMVVELGNIWPLASLITDDQLASLRETVERSAACTDVEEFIRLDSAFHLAMLGFFDNSLVKEMGKHIVRFFHEVEKNGLTVSTDAFARVPNEHREIVDALAGHDGAEVVRLLATHILNNPILHANGSDQQDDEARTESDG